MTDHGKIRIYFPEKAKRDWIIGQYFLLLIFTFMCSISVLLAKNADSTELFYPLYVLLLLIITLVFILTVIFRIRKHVLGDCYFEIDDSELSIHSADDSKVSFKWEDVHSINFREGVLFLNGGHKVRLAYCGVHFDPTPIEQAVPDVWKCKITRSKIRTLL